ncbi:MAG: endonuclease/exonuclease/phosphatase family protein [Candidatus Neomarinimicrobiota bacterium]
MKAVINFIILLFLLSCEPWVETFEDASDLEAVMFEALEINDSLAYDGGSVRVLTWNIRVGLGRFPWIYDSCGDSVIREKSLIEKTLTKIADKLNNIDADIVLLQEVDFLSKRSGYINQIQFLLDNTGLNYGAYASMYKTQFAPSDGLGMVDGGNAILSKYKLESAERIPLALRTDQSSIVQYFYLRRNILKAKIPDLARDGKDFYAVNIHATAFATDDTKQKHINKYIEVLNEINNVGDLFVTGGDLNSVPPGSTIDFCENDKCAGEECNEDYKSNEAYHGSYFGHFDGEPDLLVPLYGSYSAAIDSADANLPTNFTHATSTSFEINNIKYDRKLDYLFTNGSWSSSVTHQGAWELSDHIAVSSYFNYESE